MDREKLNKAAEEARRETAIQARSDWHHSLGGVSLDVSIDELVESAFAGGAEWVLSLPLSERLTEAEKERIRDFINAERTSPLDAIDAVEFLNSFLGADLFKEK